ncbi:MAG: MarR family transcriptional regulator [Rhodospirillales bacterium]|nr:MarR family transcriptional regulator [Rhodospirillales bacterium]
MKKASPSPRSPAGEARDYQSRIPYLLGAISNRTVATGSRFYQDQFGISLAEGRLMYVLGYEGVLTARRASEIMGIDKGATSRALAGLQRRGLVHLTVDDDDTRQRTIRFTRSGQALYDRLIVASLERERKLLSVFSEKEEQVLAALLKRLQAHVSSPIASKPIASRRGAR